MGIGAGRGEAVASGNADAGRPGTAAMSGASATVAGAGGALDGALLEAFAADVEAAMERFQVPGAAVAIVRGDDIVFSRGFGVRDRASGAPVTSRTRFRIGSITKSLTATMLATFVDDGVFAWDDRVVDLKPAFRAPSEELTASLRLRDLLGMGSGIAESADLSLPAVEFFMSSGEVTPRDVLRGVAELPVVAEPGAAFSYNNTLVAAAAFAGLLAAGAPADGLSDAYAAAVRDRVLAPAGMADAAIVADPRPLGEDYAVGYARDVFGDLQPLPFVALDGVAPAGSGLASAEDLARYAIMQMNGGVGGEGRRVASEAALGETHRPGIAVERDGLFPADLQPDTASLHYAMGWLVEVFRDGRRLVWHSGGIDGFAAFVGFFPEERIGFAVLNNRDRAGGRFNVSVQASLLDRLFGLNRSVPAYLAGLLPEAEAQRADLAARARRPDPAAVAPLLGWYERGFRLRLDGDGSLLLDHDIRSLPLLALPDGDYVVACGPDVVQEIRVAFGAGEMGPTMTLEGFPTVRWLTGG